MPTFEVPRATHDDEAEPSGTDTTRETSPPVPPVVTAAQVTAPDTLAQILQTLTQTLLIQDLRQQ